FRSRNVAYTFGGLSAAGSRGAVSALNQYLFTTQGLIDPATSKPYTYTTFAEDGGDPRLDIAFQFLNWFVQNEFRVTPRLTLNVGVRYETILFPGLDPEAPYPLSRKIDGDRKNFRPASPSTGAPLRTARPSCAARSGPFTTCRRFRSSTL